MSMVILFSLIAILSCYEVYCISEVLYLGFIHTVLQVMYFIMAPIVGTRIYDEMEVNRANVDKLKHFYVINDCAD